MGASGEDIFGKRKPVWLAPHARAICVKENLGQQSGFAAGSEDLNFGVDVWVDHVDRKEADGDGFASVMRIPARGAEADDFVSDPDWLIGVDVSVFGIDHKCAELAIWAFGFLRFSGGAADEVDVLFERDEPIKAGFGGGVVW